MPFFLDVVECYPTHVRTSAMGVLAAGGRLGAVSAQFVNGSLEKNIPLLLFVTCACTVVGGLTAWMLPHDTAGSAMEEIGVIGVGEAEGEKRRSGSGNRSMEATLSPLSNDVDAL
jgi:hypothetical protein